MLHKAIWGGGYTDQHGSASIANAYASALLALHDGWGGGGGDVNYL